MTKSFLTPKLNECLKTKTKLTQNLRLILALANNKED